MRDARKSMISRRKSTGTVRREDHRGVMLTFEEWERSALERFREDPVWRMQVYKRACYAMEQAWPDTEALAVRRTTREIAGQLFYAVGSVGANIVEGYSRGSGRDRARFYEYALGSARESRHWYRAGTAVLNSDRVSAAVDTLNRITYLLLRMIPRHRSLPSAVRPRR